MEDGKTEEERVRAEANEERLKKAKDKVRTLVKNARDRKALPSREEVEDFELLTRDYVDLFQVMVQNKCVQTRMSLELPA